MATTINALRTAQRSFSVREWMNEKSKSLNLWLDTRSEFYSRIAEFSVTRRFVLRVNAVSLCLIIGMVAIEQHPVASVISALCAGWLVYRLNKSEKNQRSLTDKGRKGGTL